VDHQRIVFSGKALQDDRTLEEYGIKAGTTLHLMKKPASAQPSAQSSSANLVEEKPEPVKVDPLKQDSFWKEVDQLLKKHFDRAEAERIKQAWKSNAEAQ